MHIIIHKKAGEIRNKHRPVTDFVRVVSVGARPKSMTVDTPVRFIPKKTPVGIDLGQPPKNALHSWCFLIVAQRSSRCPYTLLLIELPTPVNRACVVILLQAFFLLGNKVMHPDFTLSYIKKPPLISRI